MYSEIIIHKCAKEHQKASDKAKVLWDNAINEMLKVVPLASFAHFDEGMHSKVKNKMDDAVYEGGGAQESVGPKDGAAKDQQEPSPEKKEETLQEDDSDNNENNKGKSE